MTLQQLRYLIAIAECGSFGAAARELYVSQSSLSVAVKDVERETGVTVFVRSSKGVTLTRDGTELLGYARQVVEQADLMDRRYNKLSATAAQRLAVSTQHYAFSVEAFLDFVAEIDADGYDFTLRETRTADIIDDVKNFRSDVGILYKSNYNRRVIEMALEDAGLVFESLFCAKPHVFLGETHPLAKRTVIEPEELADYPRYSFEQGQMNSFHYAEEPLAQLPHKKRIAVSDRGTLSNLLAHQDGYTVSTGVLSSEMYTGIVAVPLHTDEIMDVGYVVHAERQPSTLALQYLQKLQLTVEGYMQGCAEL